MNENKDLTQKIDNSFQTQTQHPVKNQTQNPTQTQTMSLSMQKTSQDQEKTLQQMENTNHPKQLQQIIDHYESKILIMSQTIFKLNKQNQKQKDQFRLLNQKLNKAFAKLNPQKLKSNSENNTQNSQELSTIKKQLQNQVKKNKILKKQLQIIKETQLFLNDGDKMIKMKNDLTDRQRQIKELREKLRGYQRAQQNEKKMTHYRKQEQMNKKLNQLNEQNIFLKKKVTELKSKIQQTQKQRIIQKAQQAIQKSIVRFPKKNEQKKMIQLQKHLQEIKKLQEQIKVYENSKSSAQKTFKQQIQTLKKHNNILNQQINELKLEIKRKNKQKFLLQQRNQFLQTKKSKILNQQKSNTIDHNISLITDISDIDDKNKRSRTFSLKKKKQIQAFDSFRKQFLGLSYGNLGNPYNKNDDLSKIDVFKGSFTIASLKFQYFQEHIVSLKVSYRFNQGYEQTIQTFSVDHQYSNLKTAQLKFNQHEYIKELSIYGGKMIEFIQLRTSRNQVLEVGNQKSQLKCKKFEFEIRNNEKPVAFGAITEVKSINQVKKDCLVVLGLITKKKDVLIGKKRVISNSKQIENSNRTIHLQEQQNDK